MDSESHLGLGDEETEGLELDHRKLGAVSGRLSKELIKQGLLSEDVLDQLHREWQDSGMGRAKGSRKEGGGGRKKKKK